MLSFKNRPCILGKAIKIHNVRSEPDEGEEEGDAGELIAARDLILSKVMLTKAQFNKLIGEQAYNSFFDDGKKPPEPAFPNLGPLRITDTFKDCSATIVFGVSAKTIEIESGAKVKNISVKPATGGVAEMKCTLQAVLPRNLLTLDLEEFFGKEITVSLKLGQIDDEIDDAQEKLALEDESDKPDKTRILEPGQAERETETQRQLGEALRGLEADQKSH